MPRATGLLFQAVEANVQEVKAGSPEVSGSPLEPLDKGTQMRNEMNQGSSYKVGPGGIQKSVESSKLCWEATETCSQTTISSDLCCTMPSLAPAWIIDQST